MRLARIVHLVAVGVAVLVGVGLDLLALAAGWPRWAAVAVAVTASLAIETLGRTARFVLGRE